MNLIKFMQQSLMVISMTSYSPLIFCDEIVDTDATNLRDFGGWSIDKDLFDYIRNILPVGKRILELGSGWASGEFSKYYTIFSVEHDTQWIGKFETLYIYAPIKNGWYDVNVLKNLLPRDYDLILVDGPPKSIGRKGFLKNIDLFKNDIPIIFDDVNRDKEYNLMVKVAKILNRKFSVFITSSIKKFGVIENISALKE